MYRSSILPFVGLMIQTGTHLYAQPSTQERCDKGSMRLFLCGDVMLGRGIDQVLPSSVDPVLREPAIQDATRYVELARRSGAGIPEEIEGRYLWGDALSELDSFSPALRIINLETSITSRGEFSPGKHVHYRMHPDNVEVLKVADIDAAVISNNHVLDFGRRGLRDTLSTLANANIAAVGAGRTESAAEAPAVFSFAGDSRAPSGRVLLFAFAASSSGVPDEWAASERSSGVNFVSELNESSADRIATEILTRKRPGDLVIVSVHWGSNWGYSVPENQRMVARRLIDAGAADIIHGHSSHHPRPIEVYRDRLILYGCGDMLNDYEGIGGHQEYRPELTLMYFPEIDRRTGKLRRLVMSPMRIEGFKLTFAGGSEAEWLAESISRYHGSYGTSVKVRDDGRLELGS